MVKYIYKWGKAIRAYTEIRNSLEASRSGDLEVETLADSFSSDNVVLYARFKAERIKEPEYVNIKEPGEIAVDKPDTLWIIAGIDDKKYNKEMEDYLKQYPNTKVNWIVTDTRFLNPPPYLKNVEILSHLINDNTYCSFTSKHALYMMDQFAINRKQIVIVANQVTETLDKSRWSEIVRWCNKLKELEFVLIGEWPSITEKPSNLKLEGGLSPSKLYRHLKDFDFALHLDNKKDRPKDKVLTPKVIEAYLSGLIVIDGDRKDYIEVIKHIKYTNYKDIIKFKTLQMEEVINDL